MCRNKSERFRVKGHLGVNVWFFGALYLVPPTLVFIFLLACCSDQLLILALAGNSASIHLANIYVQNRQLADRGSGLDAQICFTEQWKVNLWDCEMMLL